MKRVWQITNILALAFALAANYLVGAQVLALPPIGDISDTYATLLTPATYAFSIWSLIYLLLVVLVVYQARDVFRPQKDNTLPQAIGPLFVVSCLCNGLWTFIFVKEYVALSVVVILVLAASLYGLLVKLRIATYNARPATIVCVWWPLLVYTGWVTVASVVNIASWLRSLGITIEPAAACLVLVALLAGLLILLARRNVRELLLASAWGITAIGVQQWQLAGGNRMVAGTAFAVSGVLLAAVAVHAYKNRRANFLSKVIG